MRPLFIARFSGRRGIAAFGVMALLVFGFLTSSLLNCTRNEVEDLPKAPLRHSLYVWQRQWTQDVVGALAQTAPSVTPFMVLVGELERANPSWRCTPASVDWRALAASGNEVWAVFRIHAKYIEECESPEDEFAELARHCMAAAEEAGLALQGIQLDYDCPTEMLSLYAAFLRKVAKRLPEIDLSITALPTWLTQPSFSEVIADLNCFVLQVHGLERPASAESPLVLCDAEKIPLWTKQAGNFNVPFYVALPTYGYRVYFDGTGAVAAVGAESFMDVPREFTFKDIHADPMVMAAVVESMTSNRPPSMLGIAWFRMPVASDKYNWPWPVLATVMRGKKPAPNLAAKVQTPREDLRELWISNQDSYQPRNICIALQLTGVNVLASDVVNGFSQVHAALEGSIQLKGSAPRPGESMMAAWWVIEPATDDKNTSVKVIDMEMCQ